LVLIVVSIFESAAETFPEIVLIVVSVHVVAVVAVGRVLIGIAVPIVSTPVIFAVGHPGTEAFLIAIIDRLPQQVGAILIDLVIRPAATVAINWSSVKIWIVVIVVALCAQAPILFPQMFQILLLEAILRVTSLLLQHRVLSLQLPLLLVQAPLILIHPLLLLLY